MSEDGQGRPSIDSRRWTGRGLGVSGTDRRAARQAFRAAAGRRATAPRRAAAIVCGIGGVLVPCAVVALSPDHLPLIASRLRAAIAHGVGADTAPPVLHWLAALPGPALAIGLAASLAGTASAWRNRTALAKGARAVPADRLESGGGDVAVALVAMLPSHTVLQPSPSAILASGMMSYFLSRGMTLMAERLVAAPGEHRRIAARMVIVTLAFTALLVASAFR